jgi:hypothetical protein
VPPCDEHAWDAAPCDPGHVALMRVRADAPEAKNAAVSRATGGRRRADGGSRRCGRARARQATNRRGRAGPAPTSQNNLERFRKAGPRMTMNIAGKMKITVGKSILIGAFIARSSAAA